MKNKKIIIAGGTGFIGQAITNYFGKENEIVVLTRAIKNVKTNAFGQSIIGTQGTIKPRYVKWDGVTLGDWKNEFEGADIVINLTGKTVNCRYNAKNKIEIFNSRTNAVKVIGQAIQKTTVPPKLWINAASATIYPHATGEPRDENFSHFVDGFSVQVCQLWEKTFYDQRTPFTRKVALRMAITLGAGGVMTPYFNLLKFGLGGKQGSGKQMYSWIHVEDTCRMIDWVMEHNELEGTFNGVSPNAVSNTVFMKTLRKATGTFIGLPAYEWMLAFGGRLIGTEPELVLKSRWVLPTKIMQSGFKFKYPDLENAIKEIISKTPRKQYHLF